MTPLNTPASRAAALRTLGLPEPRACDKQTVARAHRSLARRYHPNEATPPAAAPYFRRLQKAYEVLEVNQVSPANTGEEREPSSEPNAERVTAPAFVNAGTSSRSSSPSPSTGEPRAQAEEEGEVVQEDAFVQEDEIVPPNPVDVPAPPPVAPPRQTWTALSLTRLKHLFIAISLNAIGMAILGERFIIVDVIADFIFGTIFTAIGSMVGFRKGLLHTIENSESLEKWVVVAKDIADFVSGFILTVAGTIVGFGKGFGQAFLQSIGNSEFLRSDSTASTTRHQVVEVRTVYLTPTRQGSYGFV